MSTSASGSRVPGMQQKSRELPAREFRLPQGVAQVRRPSQICRHDRIVGRGIIAPRRSNSADLHRPWRAIYDPRQSTLEYPDLRQVSRSRFAPELFATLVGGRWNVALKVHAVVQDTDDLDRPFGCNLVHQEVTSATSMSCDVERAKAPHDLVAGPGPRNVRTVQKIGDRPNECVPIGSRLSRAEILSGPFQDIRKIELRGCAETNAPFLPGHGTTIPKFGK